MRRRAALRALAATVTLPATAAARESPTATPPPPTARPGTFGPGARLPLDGAKEAVVADGYAYVAVTDGFAVVDLTDPTAPEVVHETREVAADRDDPMEKVYDLKVDGDLLAVVGPANPASGFQGLVVYDVSDPADPARVTAHPTDFFNHNCYLDDGVAYLCGNGDGDNPVVTVDARTGEELDRWTVTEVQPGWAAANFSNWPLHDVWVHGDYAYLAQWDAGTWVLDASDPADLQYVTRLRGADPERYASMSDGAARRAALQPPGNDHFVTVGDDGGLLGVGVEAWDAESGDGEGGPGAIHLFDNADPENPTPAATIDPPPTDDATRGGVWTTSHNFEIHGDLLFSSWYRGGVRVHDVSDPANPTELAAWRDSARAEFWTAQRVNDRFLLASSRRDPRTDGRGDYAGAALYVFENPAHETPTATLSPTRTASELTGTDTSGPGFGALGALAALGAAGWTAWRRRG